MTFTLTIAGEAHELLADTLRINYHANDISDAQFDVVSLNASYRPPLDAEVIIELDGVRLLGGLIDRPTESGLCGGARPHIVTSVSVVDWTAYTERRMIVGGGFPAGYTLLQALTGLVTWLTPYGVTLDPSQVTGPTLPLLEYPLTTVREALDGLAAVTAASGEPFVWELDEYKVLRMFQPSTLPAPFDILTDAPGYVTGDITVEPSKEGYANRVYVIAAPKEEDGRTETFTGDGVTTTFALTYRVTTWVRGVVNCDGVDETLNNTGDADPATWTYDPPTNTITRNPMTPEGLPAGAPGVGVVCWLRFNGVFDGRAMAEDASAYTDPWEKAITVDNVDDLDTLQEIAVATLAESLLIPKTVKYPTMTRGLRVGQSQVFNVPARDLDATGLITELSLSDRANRLWWDVTALTGAKSNVNRGYRATVRNWSGSSPSGSVTVATTPSDPIRVDGGFIGRKYFTTTGSHTYTPSSGTQSIEIELVGAGGGGAGVASAAASQVNLGSGGGGGGYLRKRLTIDFSGATIVVGAAGAGGASGDNSGASGGSTTFTDTSASPTTYTASGGAGGSPRGSFAPPITCAGSLGGTSVNGDVNVVGASAAPGIASNQFVGWAGGGGGSPFGSYTDAALVVNATSSTGPSANGHGAGGSGAVSSNAGGAKAGGNGSDGMAVIWEYV